MKKLFNNIIANIYKLIHSKLLLMHLIVPILGISIFCAYYSYSPWNEENKILAFIQTISMAFPLMISIVTSMLYEDELKAGNFQNILSAPYSKTISHTGNLISLCLFGLFSCILTVMGFGIIFGQMGFHKFSLSNYFRISLILFMANITLYILQYVVCFAFGNGVSLGIGIVGTLLSPLLYLELGDNIWKYIPCGYGIRIVSYDFYKYTDIKIYNQIWDVYRSGIITISIITIIMFMFFILWSNKWQGKNTKVGY